MASILVTGGLGYTGRIIVRQLAEQGLNVVSYNRDYSEIATDRITSVQGELYDVPIGDIRTDFLPEEPEELELTVIELSDGRSVLAVGLRPGLLENKAGELTEITDHGGWRRYRGLPEPDNTTVS